MSDATSPTILAWYGTSTTASKASFRRWTIVALAFAILYFGNGFYRNKTADLWAHPDQAIPVKVLQSMHARSDLDTDWAKADLPEYFRVCRYNFSGYLIAAYAIIRFNQPDAFTDDLRLNVELRRISRVFSTLTLLLVFLLLATKRGIPAGVACALAVASVPQLLQDANYARPEALSTFCFTLCFAICLLRPMTTVRRSIALTAVALLSGFLASIKITYAVTALFLIPIVVDQWSHSRDHGVRITTLGLIIALATVGLMVGFVIGAPATLLDPAGYLDGLQALQRQYAVGHPPHGRIEAGMFSQGAAIAGYYLAALGALPLLLHLAGYVGKGLNSAKYAYLAILIITLGGFLLQKVFFERNFSLLLPSFVIIAIVGLDNLVQWLGRWLPKPIWSSWPQAVLSAFLLLFCWSSAFLVTRDLAAFFDRRPYLAMRESREAFSGEVMIRIGATSLSRLSFADVHAKRYPKGETCALYSVSTFNDDWSSRFLRDLPARFRIVDTIASTFSGIPVSTLHTYHSPTDYLFIDASQCEEDE
ncbi:hypothetical protein [Pseudoxanthomonas wuyuanensis]|uniref:Dolichyl-phosphate-mannose-protein mannosyltransferase n=1 Tax=Pseudoxanthomonas wuyuanensis TaxID=1073196 RepID=A0A286DAE3_9GAMM|nr:hypothetical protein [Pseudoxanthomonas wuyuanensis]KAF1720561.1 hypothetical protein CSC75_10885 [Pseudoxanthomonas wuyuanensis]SOD55618.1 hypothetical protein SAMN06296416_107215 [Pseudoxanthomonas wuyuanensis]